MLLRPGGHWAAALFCLCAPAMVLAAAAAATTSTPTGPGSISGVWQRIGAPNGSPILDDMYEPRAGVLTTADGTPLPTQPWAAAIVEKRLADAEAGHPFASTKVRCLPGGIPDMMFGSGPMQILETPGQVTVLRQEFTYFRIIKLDRKHAVDPDPGYLGDSIGHWEGDTLVVDTIGLSEKTTIKGVIPHSDQLHVVERLRPTGKDTLEIRATIEDPKAFTRPWPMVTRLRRLPDGLIEYFCENNRNAPDANGYTGMQMPSTSR